MHIYVHMYVQNLSNTDRMRLGAAALQPSTKKSAEALAVAGVCTCVSVSVCVYVYGTERERERESAGE